MKGVSWLLQILGMSIVLFMLVVYWVHICIMPDVSIDAIRLMAIVYSAAVSCLTLSIAAGIIALLLKQRLRRNFLIFSAITSAFGCFFPSARLWILSYYQSLAETILIAICSVGLLVGSALLADHG